MTENPGSFLEQLADAVTERMFAVLTTKQRKNSPHYCGAPGDGENAFPVPDAPHARNALARAHFSKDPAHVRACVARVVKEEGWDVNVSMGAESDPAPVIFSAAVAEDLGGAGDSELLKAPVFHLGDYPEQGFSLNAVEADALIAGFAPVASRHGHPRSKGPLDGKMGTLTRLWREGTTLFGLFDVPKWLTALIPPEQRKISLGFARWPEKRIEEWSWVTEPIIPDAQLEAAFAAFAGRRHSVEDQAMLDSAATLLHHAGANAPGTSMAGGMSRYAREAQRMSWTDELRALFNRSDAPVRLTDPPVPEHRDDADPQAQFAQQQAALAEDRRKLAEERATFAKQQFQATAAQDVERLIREGRVLPAENAPGPDGVPTLVAFGAQLLADDATGAAIFGQTGGNRYAAWMAVLAARPGAAVGAEKVPVTVFGTAAPNPNRELTADEIAARKRRNLERTPTGQKALRDEEARRAH